MSSALDRYRKRRFRTVDIGADKFTIRSMTKGEATRVEALPKELRTALAMAFAMLEDDGKQVFAMADGEDDAKFAARVDVEISDIQTETIRDLAVAIANLGKPPKLDVMVKNSEETTT